MPNGGLTPEELKKIDAPLKEVDWIFKNFAKKYGFVFNHSTYHDWPCVYVVNTQKSKNQEYFLKLTIGIRPEDNVEISHVYSMGVGVHTTYGLKELYAFIPILNRKRDSWKRLGWGKSLGEFKESIDPERLKQLLEEAKQILDNFNESQLQEINNSVRHT